MNYFFRLSPSLSQQGRMWRSIVSRLSGPKLLNLVSDSTSVQTHLTPLSACVHICSKLSSNVSQPQDIHNGEDEQKVVLPENSPSEESVKSFETIIGSNSQPSLLNAQQRLADFLREVEHKKKQKQEIEDRYGDQISLLNEELQKKLKYIKLEVDLLITSGSKAPRHVTNYMWTKLLELDSERTRRKMLHKFMLEEKFEWQAKKRQEKHAARLHEIIEKISRDGPIQKNTIFLRINTTTMNQWYYSKLARALQNGPHLIFDLDFDKYMAHRDIISLVDQIHHSHGVNKLDKDPFHFYICNAKKESSSTVQISKSTTEDYGLENQMITMTDQDCLDLFPKDKLIYLTPDSPHEMLDFDHDSVYVIGGLVENGPMKPLTLAKCKRLGIKTAKLPLDKHLR